MKARKDTPRDNFTPALKAIGNLMLQELNKILNGAEFTAMTAHDEIKLRMISQRRAPFNRHFLPLQKELVSVLTEGYRRYFKLALAHPRQTSRDPHQWTWSQLQPFISGVLESIRDWYILACDGDNQPVLSIEGTPGETVSLPMPPTVAPLPSPKSWRAPAWLFSVSPFVGFRPLKSEHVPETDSEERLGAAHTRLLLKGARRVFLWELGAAIETVRNEEIAAAGAIPAPTISETGESNKHKGSKRQLRGTEGLVRKVVDLSRWMHGLTEKQQLAFSLKHEYGLGLTDVAARMGIDRKTAYGHVQAAATKIDQARSAERRMANRVKDRPDE